jgi:hypothetical protein
MQLLSGDIKHIWKDSLHMKLVSWVGPFSQKKNLYSPFSPSKGWGGQHDVLVAPNVEFFIFI